MTVTDTSISDSFAKLKFEWDKKSADLTALEVRRHAAEQRLQDNLRRESESREALKITTDQFAAARRDLAEATRSAAKIKADAIAEGNAIVAAKHIEADGFLRGIMSAVQAAASLIPSAQTGKKRDRTHSISND
jgi:hypothetical protein